jgi:hypothetical protein
VRAARQQSEHARSVGGIHRLAEYRVIADHRGVSSQHRVRSHAAGGNHRRGGLRLVACHAQRIGFRRFAGKGCLVDVGAALRGFAQLEHLEGHTDLAQQFAAAGTARCEIDEAVGHRCSKPYSR